MTWRTFWRFTLAMTLATIVGGLAVTLFWFFVILERLP